MFWKKNTNQAKPKLDTAKEFQKILDIYSTYDEIPYINLEKRNIDIWVQSLHYKTDTLIPAEFMTRNKGGLILGELVLLDWLNAQRSTVDLYPDYFEQKFGVDCEQAVHWLLQEDYLDIIEGEEALAYIPLVEMNSIFDSFDLPICETHEEAVQQMVAEFSESYWLDLVDRGFYAPMEKGAACLKAYQNELMDYTLSISDSE